MPGMELKTIFLVSSVISAMLTIYLFFVWVNYRKEYNGIRLFTIGVALNIAGNFLIALQD